MNRRNLGHHVGAVAVVVDHLLQTANLAFDASKALEIPRLYFRIDTDRFSRAVCLAGAFCVRTGSLHGFHPRNRRLFVTTLTELSAIAALAITGLSKIPRLG